ncbi:MAG: TonB-dependent receptor [Ignavibacteriales bacterium]|nr:TonB-dependent receptor [Ignavibacteriales bacterium]
MCLILTLNLSAQNSKQGAISGTVVDKATSRPMEFVNVVLRNKVDSAIVAGTETDSKGKFGFIEIAPGEYFIRFGFIGYSERITTVHKIDARSPSWNLGTVSMTESSVNLDEVLVTGQKAFFNNSVDRKVYNIGQDIMSKSGSTSELLQNIPSVEVDIDGNVSLRGSSGVLILINGKTSPLMAKSSATVLQQMPASSIERIEIITNPSAKYKPDGASGIINIVLKKNTGMGSNGSVSANIGNDNRANGNVRFNYSPGDFTLFGSYSLRADNRNRINTDTRTQIDAASALSYYRDDLYSYANPLSHSVSLGAEYTIDPSNSLGLSGNYFHNGFVRTEKSTKTVQNALAVVTDNYGRNRWDDEYEMEYGLKFFAEHKFEKKDHKLRLEFSNSKAPEQEDNHYTDLYWLPLAPNQYDNTLIKQTEGKNELTVDYSNPLSEESTLEAGYAGEMNSRDMDFYGEFFDPNRRAFVKDLEVSNRFLFDETIHAFYATYEQSFGSFGMMAGLRAEQSSVKSNLVTLDSSISNSYFSLFPTVHFSYKLNEAAEVRLSYSRRTHRPEGDDLNPFPEYRDPRNISAGNPKLLPEYVHSVELGCKFETDQISLFPALYYRYTYDRFTSITTPLNDSTLLTTRTNLASDQSLGVEVILSGNIGEILTSHASANVFFNQIDASNLGYSGSKSTTSWSGAVTMNLNATRSSMVQMNASFNSRRLTAQGENLPSYVANAGIRQELLDGKLALVLTVADLFKTLKRTSELSTPLLNQKVINARDSRIVYFGFTYYFGSNGKKSKEETLKFDDGI